MIDKVLQALPFLLRGGGVEVIERSLPFEAALQGARIAEDE
jgi:hypothetical protein